MKSINDMSPIERIEAIKSRNNSKLNKYTVSIYYCASGMSEPEIYPEKVIEAIDEEHAAFAYKQMFGICENQSFTEFKILKDWKYNGTLINKYNEQKQ